MRASIGLLLIASLSTTVDRRVVDRITIGDARSEQEHAYAGEDVSSSIAGGRQTRAWMRYARTVFDDTEVTVACTFAGSDGQHTFELVVENQLVTTSTFRSRESQTVEFRVPLALTKGQTNILVMLRAINGSTPALLELRSIQDHNE